MRLAFLLTIFASVAVAGEVASPPCVNCTPMTVSVRAAKGVGNRSIIPDSIISFAFQPASIPIAFGDTVTWTNNSGGTAHTTTSDVGSPDTWDSGTLSNGSSFSHTFNSYGRFPFHCSIHPSMTAAVVVAPPAPTLGSNSPVKEGQSLNLTATSGVGGVAFAWTGPNGFTSTAQNQSINPASAAAAGTYNCTVSINGATSTAASTNVVIVSPPTAGNNGPLCEGQTLNLSASTVANATYAWTGPNSFTSSAQNPSISNVTQAQNAGTYSVTVTVGAVTSDPATTNVTINTLPAAPTAGSDSPVCENGTLHLTATTIANATYSWTGPNNFMSSNQNPILSEIAVAGAGTYNVVVTVNGCNSNSASTVVAVTAAPSAPTAGSNSPICVGQTLNLTASTVANATYAWSGPNGFTSTLQNPSRTNAATADSGTYLVTVTDMTSGCTSTSASVTVDVAALVAPSVSNNGPVCTGQTLQLNCAQSGAVYAWTGPNGFTSAQQNPSISTVTLAAAGDYHVDVTVNTCALPTATTTVVINATPAAPVAANNGPILEGATLNLTATTIANATYAWTGPNNFTSSQQNPSIANAPPAATGTYVVAVTVNGCTSSSASTSATVTAVAPILNSGPSATPSAPEILQSIQFSAIFSDAETITLAWNFGDGTTATGADVSHGYVNAGTYHVTVTATDASNLSTTGTLDLVVKPKTLAGLGGAPAAHQDSDGDGFSDEIELGAGTSASNAADTPFGGASAGTVADAGPTQLSISLNFLKDNTDTISLSGLLPIHADFSIDGQSILIDVGGVIKTFKLNAKGQAKSGNDTFKVTVRAKNKQVIAQSAKYMAKFSKGSFKKQLADYGLTGDADVKSEPRSVNVTLLFNVTVLQEVLAQTYTAKQGKTGKTKSPK